MKKIITPSVKEHCVYFSDFTGKCFGDFGPEITMTIEFNYGSKYDGNSINLHLTDKEVAPILDLIKSNLTSETNNYIKIPLS